MRKRNQQRGSAFVEFALLGSSAFRRSHRSNVHRLERVYLRRAGDPGHGRGSLCIASGLCRTSGVPAYQSAVRNFIVYGNPTGGTSSTVPRLTTSNVIVNLDRTASPGLVTVSISGVSLGIGAMGSFTLINRPSVTMSYAGYCF